MESLKRITKNYLALSFSTVMMLAMALGVSACEGCGKTEEGTAGNPELAFAVTTLQDTNKTTTLNVNIAPNEYYVAGDFMLKVSSIENGTVRIGGVEFAATEAALLSKVLGVEADKQVKGPMPLEVEVKPTQSTAPCKVTVVLVKKHGSEEIGNKEELTWNPAQKELSPNEAVAAAKDVANKAEEEASTAEETAKEAARIALATVTGLQHDNSKATKHALAQGVATKATLATRNATKVKEQAASIKNEVVDTLNTEAVNALKLQAETAKSAAKEVKRLAEEALDEANACKLTPEEEEAVKATKILNEKQEATATAAQAIQVADQVITLAKETLKTAGQVIGANQPLPPKGKKFTAPETAVNDARGTKREAAKQHLEEAKAARKQAEAAKKLAEVAKKEVDTADNLQKATLAKRKVESAMEKAEASQKAAADAKQAVDALKI
jgi:hypothetical protein